MKIMITTRGDFVSPRFDLSPEVIIATYYDRQLLEEPRSIIISDVSAEIICDLALQENVATVICGGIEEQHYPLALVVAQLEVFLELATVHDGDGGEVGGGLSDLDAHCVLPPVFFCARH